MTLQPAPGDTGKPCGVDYELKAYVAETADEKPHKRNSVRLAIRKVVYAPSKQGEQPSVEVSKEFMMSPNKLHLEASLDKEVSRGLSRLARAFMTPRNDVENSRLEMMSKKPSL